MPATTTAAIAFLARRGAILLDMMLEEWGQQLPLLDAHESLV